MQRHVSNHEYFAHRARKHLWLGLVLIIAGSLFLGDRLGIIDAGLAWHFWPVLLGLLGVIKIISAKRLTQAIKGGLVVFLAFWLYACSEHLFGWTFRTSWPVIVIAFGVSMMLRGVMSKPRISNEESVR